MEMEEILVSSYNQFFQGALQKKWVSYITFTWFKVLIPFFQCKKISVGDKVIAIDGQSLDGADYKM